MSAPVIQRVAERGALGLDPPPRSGLVGRTSGRAQGPVRILHVVDGLTRGGIEYWLLQVLRHIDRERYAMDFLVTVESGNAFEGEFRALGSRIIPCPQWRQPLTFARNFAAAVRQHGPYDIIHSHIHHYSGIIVALAAARGIPERIVHSHNDTRPDEADAGWRRRLYLRSMQQLIRRFATRRLAVSEIAAEDLFGQQWARHQRCAVLHCGIEFAPVVSPEEREQLRQELGLPAGALLIGHVGKFFWRKNHAFLLEIAAAAFAQAPHAWLVSVGDGPLLTDIKARARALGIAERVVFTGPRDDVGRLMGAMDVFVMPSHHEGLSLAILEAQAAGRPLVITDTLTSEADVVTPLIHRLSLSAPAATWAGAALAAAARPAVAPPVARQQMLASDFSLQRGLERLLKVYDGVA